jgi:transcriptional regulator with XRE-family HTH domain
MTSIGAKIREIRLQRGMTQAQLADGIVTPSMISQIEAEKARPSYTLLCQLANRLGMSVEFFLSDIEEQFTLATQLRVAEYWLLVKRPDRALDALTRVPPPNPPGFDYFEYHLLKARIQRALGQFSQVVPLLETLREYALRTQDERALFFIHKESGQVEYAMNNPDGAMHEWENAVRVGERLADAPGHSRVEFDSELTEVYLTMHQLLCEQDRRAEAEAYLERAQRRSQRLARLSDLAEALMEDAEEALRLGDPGRARATMDRALAYIQAARQLEWQLLIASRTALDPSSVDTIPWLRAGLAATNDAGVLIEAELNRVERLLAEQAHAVAQQRIEQCLQLLSETREHIDFGAQLGRQTTRLRLHKAQALYGTGQRDEAIKELTALIEEIEPSGDEEALLTMYECLLEWLKECADSETALIWSERAQRIIEQLSGRIVSYPL